MTQSVPVNPDVLRWARETAGLSLVEVADRLQRKSVTPKTVEEWEAGLDLPTYSQVEALAYTIYRRPLALFFFPEPPKEETLKQSFRTLPEQELERVSSRLRLLLRQAQSMRLNLDELCDSANPSERLIWRDIQFAPDITIAEMVMSVREYLNVKLDTQFDWKGPEQAFKSWRKVLEDCGVFVFKEPFKDEMVSGFCLYDQRFPLIYVNNSTPPTRQTFTLFHELAHLLFSTGGIDLQVKDYISLLRGNERQIEILCNRFAGEFLVPEDDFDLRIASVPLNEKVIGNLAALYCVSREVILRKLFDRNLVSQGTYDQLVEHWEEEAKGKSGQGGGNYYYNKRIYLGERYLQLAFSRLYQKRISIEQLADYLGVRVKSVPRMEALLFQQGGIV